MSNFIKIDIGAENICYDFFNADTTLKSALGNKFLGESCFDYSVIITLHNYRLAISTINEYIQYHTSIISGDIIEITTQHTLIRYEHDYNRISLYFRYADSEIALIIRSNNKLNITCLIYLNYHKDKEALLYNTLQISSVKYIKSIRRMDNMPSISFDMFDETYHITRLIDNYFLVTNIYTEENYICDQIGGVEELLEYISNETVLGDSNN